MLKIYHLTWIEVTVWYEEKICKLEYILSQNVFIHLLGHRSEALNKKYLPKY